MSLPVWSSYLDWWTWSYQNSNKPVFYWIWLHMIDDLLFNVETIIVLPSCIIHFMGPLKIRCRHMMLLKLNLCKCCCFGFDQFVSPKCQNMLWSHWWAFRCTPAQLSYYMLILNTLFKYCKHLIHIYGKCSITLHIK